MKYLVTMCVIATFLMFNDTASAQPPDGRPGRQGRPGPERLERLRKMRLIEVLKLNEEDAIRFFAKHSAHEDKVHDMMKSRNDVLDEIQSIVHGKDSGKDIQKLTDQILDIDQKIFAERQRFQAEVRKSLTPEQFAKFLVFERSFGRQVQDIMGEMLKERRGPPRGHEDDED